MQIAARPDWLPETWYIVSSPIGFADDCWRFAEFRSSYARVFPTSTGAWRAVRISRLRPSRPLPPEECREFPTPEAAFAYACLTFQ